MLRGGADGWDLYFTTDLCHCGPSARSGDRLSWSSFTHFSSIGILQGYRSH